MQAFLPNMKKNQSLPFSIYVKKSNAKWFMYTNRYRTMYYYNTRSKISQRVRPLPWLHSFTISTKPQHQTERTLAHKFTIRPTMQCIPNLMCLVSRAVYIHTEKEREKDRKSKGDFLSARAFRTWLLQPTRTRMDRVAEVPISHHPANSFHIYMHYWYSPYSLLTCTLIFIKKEKKKNKNISFHLFKRRSTSGIELARGYFR